jgi:hypothetical protein
MKNGTNLTQAFKALRRKGYFAKQNFMCCQSCGWKEIAELGYEKAVFYHAQDKDLYKEGYDLFLAWDGDGHEIVNVLQHYGLEVIWTGALCHRIQVKNASIVKYQPKKNLQVQIA